VFKVALPVKAESEHIIDGRSFHLELPTIIMASRNSTLPLDVISEVIGHVSLNKDILTLRALSTTCYALLEPSQRKLFNGLTIQVFSHNNRRTAYLSLNHIFHVSPHLTTYVQDLTISFETA